MAIKWGKTLTNAVIIALLIVIVVMLSRQSSGYEPQPLTVAPGPAVSAGPASLFDIKPSLECTPGPSEKASYYTQGLTPGGLCGDGDFVRNQLRDYAITDGIGGSLLEK
jgi:hypothetical protein